MQIALCTALLGGTSLLVRAMRHASGMSPGFRYSDVVVLSPGLGSSGLTDESVVAPLAELRERIAALPGVLSVAYTSVLPLGNSFQGTGLTDPHSHKMVETGVTHVSAEFFETLGIPLLAGRSFARADEARKDLVIVNEALATRLWPDENPLGKTIPVDSGSLEVVGVVRSTGTREFGSSSEPQMYMPSLGSREASLLVRYSGDVDPLLSGLPKIARETDRRFFASAAPYRMLVDRARRPVVVAASVGSAFSFIALGLAFVGLGAVASYQVAQRTREIGVRVALGAVPRRVVGMVIRQNLPPLVLGGVVGIVGSLALARLLTSLLYGLSPFDPFALLMTVGVLLAAALLAIWPPARRAAAMDPMLALRSE